MAISRYGSSSDFVTRMLLRYWKLDPEKDVAIIQSGGNDAIRIAALVAGHIDGALIGTYDIPKILESGCCTNLADLDELPIEYARFGVIVPAAPLKARTRHIPQIPGSSHGRDLHFQDSSGASHRRCSNERVSKMWKVAIKK